MTEETGPAQRPLRAAEPSLADAFADPAALGTVLIEGIGEGFFALDRQWRFVAFNPAAEAVFGLKRGDVLGRTLFEVSPSVLGGEFERRYRLVMSERTAQTFEAYSALRPDRYHEVRAFPLGDGLGVSFRDATQSQKIHRALLDREAELARVQRIGGIGGMEVDLSGEFPSRRSPEYLHLHGLPASSAHETHESWVARLHPEDRVSAERRLLDAIAANDLRYAAEYRVIRPSDGETRWIRAVAEIERDETGRALKLIGAHLDITDRKEAERAAEQSEQRFRTIANSAPVPIWVSRMNGLREFVNTAYVEFLGCTFEEALNFDWRKALHPDDLPRILAEQKAGESGLKPFTLEARYRRADGQWRWLRSESQPRWGTMGEHIGFIGVAHDVTSAKEAEQALTRLNENLERQAEQSSAQLAATEALIRTFFEHSSECHAVLVEAGNGQFRYEEVNPATLRLYDRTRAQVIGHTADEVFGGEIAARLNQLLTTCLESGRPSRYERMHGDRAIEAIATPVPNERGDARRLVVSAHDVTDRRRLEAQLRQAQKMEAVGQLTGGVAHDFNNLLTLVLGGLDLIGRQIPRLPAPAALAAIERARDMALQGVHRASALTSRLLAFSRQQALAPQSVDANKLVAGICEWLPRTLGETVALDMVLAEGLWRAYADPHQLENALVNLALNARDAMPAGGRLTIETANASLDSAYVALLTDPVEPGAYVTIAVADTGIGMDAATQARAFDPFFTTKDVGKGTGLGLSQVYGFARQSGGHVKIYSEPGVGTTVKIYLPRRLGVDPETPREELKTTDGALGVESVLVVEDDDNLRRYTTDILRELGYRVTEAADGAAAIAHLESAAALDLLLTDVVMPGMNGRELAAEAARRRPALKVLYMTGYTRDAMGSQGRLEAGVHIINKPFSFHELAARVRARLDSQA